MTIAERLRQEGHLNGLQEGHMKGLQEGLQEGLQTGLQQGKREEALRIASTLQADGIDPLTIFRITGLTAGSGYAQPLISSPVSVALPGNTTDL